MMFFYQLRNELWKLFGKKRTYIGFVMFLLAQAIILLLFRYTNGIRHDLTRRLDLMGYPAEQFLSSVTMATAMLAPIVAILLPLYVSLVGGDLLAKEAEDGTLRMMLSRPISRLRIIGLKWLAGAIFSILLGLVLGGFGALFASLLFHSGGLFAVAPQQEIFSLFTEAEGWRRFVCAVCALTFNAITIMGIALMFSCFNIKPAAATILAVSLVLISLIIQQIPYFHDLQQWFLTYHLEFWIRIFQQPIPWITIAESLSILFGVNLTLFIVGAAAFQMRDIKS
jgi:ABC-2 type transport system permease protein